MHSQRHPDPELLDRLRCGLLEDQAESRQALQEHLEHCTSCKSLYDSWQQLGPSGMGPQLVPESLQRSLDQARTQAFNEARKRKPRSLMPYATAALLLVAVSIGFWVAQPGQQDTRLATVETSADVPDLYEDIDFYLWLAEQNGNAIDAEDANPNSG